MTASIIQDSRLFVFMIEKRKKQQHSNKGHLPCCCFFLSLTKSITNSPHRKGLVPNNLQTVSMSG